MEQQKEEQDRKMVQRCKKLAYLLRHDTSYQFDEHGWRKVADLIANHGFTMKELSVIVATNDKQRFEFSEDGLRIRARQGHSVGVDAELEEATPPDVLYHGTATKYLDAIKKTGLAKRSRLHVHLSETKEAAISVGKRHGDPVVLTIDAKRMVEDGCRFFLSRNGVWLTEYVDPKYML